jgi:hypothetical protein
LSEGGAAVVRLDLRPHRERSLHKAYGRKIPQP